MKTPIITLFFLLFLTFYIYGQGLNLNDESYQKVPLKKATSTKADSLPTKVDLSPFVPSVINQGSLGTCVGVSTAYYMRTIMEAHRRQITNKDTIDALRFSPSFLYNSVKKKTDTSCTAGTEIEVALEQLKTAGVARFAEQGYPYCEANKPIAVSKSSKILDYVKLFGLNYQTDTKEIAIKKALAEGSPVIVGIQTTDSLEQLGNNGFWKRIWRHFWRFFGIEVSEEVGLWKPEKSASLRSGHAICIIGYDDTKFGVGAFRAVNSRGEDWGEDGFFWIRYSDVSEFVKYGFQAYVVSENDMEQVERSADIVVNYPYKTLDDGAIFGAIDLEPRSVDEKMRAFELTNVQRTRTAYKFSINNDKQTYLYVLDVNAAQLSEMYLLFPQSDSVRVSTNTDSVTIFVKTDSVSAFIGENTKIVLPSEKEVYALQEPSGTEYWLFLFTETPIDINAYLKAMNEGKGSLTQRVYAAFGDAIVPYNQIKCPLNKMGFELKKGHKGHIVPLTIRVNHEKRRTRTFARAL